MKKILLAFVVGSAAGVVAGCQTYDFEPVEPLAISQTTQSKTIQGKQLKPNLMFLIDKSGSMNFPTNALAANCPPPPAGGGPGCGTGGDDCPAACPTRMRELKSAMTTFLAGANRTIAWMGMAIYPTSTPGADQACGATEQGDIRVPLEPQDTDLDADLITRADLVRTEIGKLTALGGTPTGDSIQFLGGYAPLLDPNPKVQREDFILLLTDGLPNCNANNANSCGNATACKCTLTGGAAACGVPATPTQPASPFCTKGCLDKDNSAAQARTLNVNKGIRTIVIGFGADFATSGDGPETLNAIAEAGGFARLCPNGTDAECGTGNTCNTATGACSQKYYQATSAGELASVLAAISAAIDPAGACNYALLETPSDPKFLAVIVDGQNQPGGTPDTWTYSAGKVTFTGALCDKITNATPIDPVRVEFRIVTSL